MSFRVSFFGAPEAFSGSSSHWLNSGCLGWSDGLCHPIIVSKVEALGVRLSGSDGLRHPIIISKVEALGVRLPGSDRLRHPIIICKVEHRRSMGRF